MTKSEYENIANELVGESIQQVMYFEVKYDGYESNFTKNEDYDSLDYGVNLIMRSGKIFGFIWGDEFFQYGVSILNVAIQSELSECKEINVSKSVKWTRLLDRKIVDSKVEWSWVKKSGPFKKKMYYPQSLIITLEGNSVIIISAFEVRGEDHFGMTDNITVFFNKQSA